MSVPSAALGRATPPPERAALLVTDGTEERRFEFHGQATVGRDRACDIVLQDRTISRRHARIELTLSGWVLKDMGSGNGTFVRGERIDGAAPIEDGDELRFGDLPAVFENLPEPPVSKLEQTARSLTQSLSLKPVKCARPLAAFVATAVGFLSLVVLTLVEKGCLPHVLALGGHG